MRGLCIAGGIVAGLVVAACLSELPARRTPPGAKLISDAHGSLARICIQYRSDFNPSVSDTLTDLFQALANDVDIRIIVGKRSDFDFLKTELSHRGVTRLDRLTPVITGFPITPWARDRFGAMMANGHPIIAAPPVRSHTPGPRGNDERIPEILAATIPGASCLPIPFMFEGGDLLADETNTFIAANALARNTPEDVDNREGLLKRIKNTLKKNVIAIGATPEDVPDHHICMYLTPLGNKQVAVADPALGLELYRQNPTGATVDVETNTAAFKPFLNVIQCMEENGFRVIHLPLLLTRTPRVYVSYNNAILERRDGEKRIYMPVYDIPALDQAASKVFQGQGWRVVPIRVSQLYRHTGSLRCQVGIIQRH